MFIDVIGGNGTDFLNFQGQLGQITGTFTNPYSGYSLFVDDEFNINTANYNGLGGNDFLIMSAMGDFFSINDGFGNSLFQNIGFIQAGSGGDLLILADKNIVLGNTTVLGANEDDILWLNAGNDSARGDRGNDFIDGGPGDDRLNGNDGNDTLYGGAGDDRLFGDDQNDILYGGTGNTIEEVILDKVFADEIAFPALQERTNIKNLKPPGDPSLGVNGDNLSFDFDAKIELTFREGFAGYNNSLGVYRIDADGTIESASLLWENVKDAGIDVSHVIDLPTLENGGEIGFFIIANGDRRNGGYNDLDTGVEGNITFYYDFGGAGQRVATVNDDGAKISAVYDDGAVQKVLKGPLYHTTGRGGSAALNADGETHVVSGLMPGSDGSMGQVFRIGFEDLPRLGDADYEDVLFDLDVVSQSILPDGEDGNDELVGGNGNDTLYGEDGDDILYGQQGTDLLYGGRGADVFIFKRSIDAGDTIFDFNADEGDVINIRDILVSYDAATDNIEDFVTISDDGSGNALLTINYDGDVGGAYETVATIIGGVGGQTATDMVNNGQLDTSTFIII